MIFSAHFFLSTVLSDCLFLKCPGLCLQSTVCKQFQGGPHKSFLEAFMVTTAKNFLLKIPEHTKQSYLINQQNLNKPKLTSKSTSGSLSLSLPPWTSIWSNGENSSSMSQTRIKHLLQSYQDFSFTLTPNSSHPQEGHLPFHCLLLNPPASSAAICQHTHPHPLLIQPPLPPSIPVPVPVITHLWLFFILFCFSFILWWQLLGRKFTSCVIKFLDLFLLWFPIRTYLHAFHFLSS